MTATAPTAPASAAPPVAPPTRRRRQPLPYVLLVPAFGMLALALGYPLVRQVVMSFQEYGLAQQFGAEPVWVGLDNYRQLVTDPYLWQVVGRSIAFCLVNAAVTMVIGVAMAVLMTALSRTVRLGLQIALLLAWAMPWLASLTVWQWMFDAQYGIVNWVLAQLGLDFTGHSWLIQPLSFFFVATVIVVWMSVPFVAFSTYAALTQVPSDTIEAAELDGAGGWQRFRFVVVPMIKPVLMIVGLLQIIWDLRVFTQIFVLQDAGGITRETNLIGTYVYRLGIGEGQFGMAAAVAIFILLLTVALTYVYIRRLTAQEAL